jgi:acetyltransferase-like isoleucine patch superfamily enzyme
LIPSGLKKKWARFWMNFSGTSIGGRVATHLGSLFVPKYLGRIELAYLNKKGYISPNATIEHENLTLGNYVFIGDGVKIYNARNGGKVEVDDNVHLNENIYIQTGQGGNVKIGKNTHIQPSCYLLAYKGSINIGSDVQIAPQCAFYPYDHGILPGELIFKQPLTTKGDIKIGNDVWLGFGVIILSGVTVGTGSVVGAGSVVTSSIPDGSIAVGSPARVIKTRA